MAVSKWDKIDEVAVRAMAAKGASYKKIAGEFGVNDSTIRALAKRKGITVLTSPMGYKHPEKEFWINRRSLLLELQEAGLTTSEIGKRLGVSKNAVVGKLNRLGMCKSKQPATPAKEPVLFPPRGFCLFPFGDPGKPNFHFCCEPAESGRPYCPQHIRKCVRKTISLDEAVGTPALPAKGKAHAEAL